MTWLVDMYLKGGVSVIDRIRTDDHPNGIPDETSRSAALCLAKAQAIARGLKVMRVYTSETEK